MDPWTWGHSCCVACFLASPFPTNHGVSGTGMLSRPGQRNGGATRKQKGHWPSSGCLVRSPSLPQFLQPEASERSSLLPQGQSLGSAFTARLWDPATCVHLHCSHLTHLGDEMVMRKPPVAPHLQQATLTLALRLESKQVPSCPFFTQRWQLIPISVRVKNKVL